MEDWKATYRLLTHCKHLFHRRSSPNFQISKRFCSSGCRYHFNQPSELIKPYIGNYRQEFQTFKHPLVSLGMNQWNRCRSQYRCFASQATIIQRRPDFSTISSEDLSYFKNILGERGVVQDEETLDAVNTDWMRKYKGTSKLMLQPRTAEEVSQILKYCNSRCLAVVPQGGNTGLVGGSVPAFDEVRKSWFLDDHL
ncbi:D-2-hydroxyglutarate dehydrogenase, mitochondrial [Datura stramonium]|uniref:D-2-hydroxyglutarate dehydrogenase, mitochondrial n=1 Tax=Datura stramonium TaxID=4076 RepID=A0ABS8SZQ2_DATST|nr:D-2-hydroxyglutarate dehydrogenase, mitochondrial [Datura stramonium]